MSFGRRTHPAGRVDALDPERGSVIARRRILQVTPDGYLAGMRLPPTRSGRATGQSPR
jgi:hypothetical protein